MQEMSEDPQKIDEIIRHYLETGEDTSRSELAYKPPFPRPTKEELLVALSKAVKKKEQEHPIAKLPPDIDPSSLARSKAERIAKGFFSATERDPIQHLLEQSVVFLTANIIHQLIASSRWLRTAWRIANMYLDSIGAKPLAKDEIFQPVGLAEETTSYVSLKYFSEKDPFADYIAHEMAHLFHNWKRSYIGLRETRYREFLLDIDFAKRETFAFACESYNRILELGNTLRVRRRLLEQFRRESEIPGLVEDRAFQNPSHSRGIAQWMETNSQNVLSGNLETPHRNRLCSCLIIYTYPKPKLFETASLFLYYSPAKRIKECEDESFPKRLPSISNRHIDGLWA